MAKKMPSLFTLICLVPTVVLVLFGTKCLWEEGKKGRKGKRKGESISETVKYWQKERKREPGEPEDIGIKKAK